MEVLTDSESHLRDAASKKIFVEVALLKAIQAREAVNIDSILKQLQQLRSEQPGGGAVSPATPDRRSVEHGSGAKPAPGAATAPPPAKVIPAAKPATQPATAAAPTQATSAIAGDLDLAGLWQNILDAAGRASPFTRSYLAEAIPISLVKSVFTIGFDPEFRDQLELVNNQKTHSLLQTKFQELGHPNIQIKFILAEAPNPPAATAPAASVTPAPSAPPARQPGVAPSPAAVAPPSTPSKPATGKLNAEDFKNDPLIQKALEVFKGQIVEVRA
jgi:DNA polymerase-3 subunit gamma/tau